MHKLRQPNPDGEQLVNAKDGEPADQLVAIVPTGQKRIGLFAGEFTVPGDFDETPTEVAVHFS